MSLKLEKNHSFVCSRGGWVHYGTEMEDGETTCMGEFPSTTWVLGTLLRPTCGRQVPLAEEPSYQPWHFVLGW